MSWALLALDSDLSLAWDLPCTVTIAELGSPLPCVESLWQAESAEEWMGMSMEQAASAHKSRLSDLLCTSRLGVGGPRQTGDRLTAQASSAKESSMHLRHSSPMTRLVLSAAMHNLVLSRGTSTRCCRNMPIRRTTTMAKTTTPTVAKPFCHIGIRHCNRGGIDHCQAQPSHVEST